MSDSVDDLFRKMAIKVLKLHRPDLTDEDIADLKLEIKPLAGEPPGLAATPDVEFLGGAEAWVKTDKGDPEWN